MPNGVHYCSATALYKVWIDGSVIAGSHDLSVANGIYIARLRRSKLKDFPAGDQWMVAAYGD
jgi:hypothetical protein